MTVSLEPLGKAHLDEEIERSEHSRSSDAWILSPKEVEELDGSHGPTGTVERARDELSLGGEPSPRALGGECGERRAHARARATHREGERSSAGVGIISGPSQTRLSRLTPPALATASQNASPTSY